MNTPNDTSQTPEEEAVPEEVQAYLNVDQAQEDAEFERIHRRNRKRVLIPLGLLIALYAVLSLFGDPIAPSPKGEPAPPSKNP